MELNRALLGAGLISLACGYHQAHAVELTEDVSPSHVDFVVPTHSWHIDGRDMAPQHWNDWNPGFGIEYRFDASRPDGFFVGALSYKDSYYKFAYTAYGGYRYSLPIGGDFSLDATIRAGYINGSGYTNWGAIPSVGVTYRKTSIELEILPAVKSTQASVLALMFRQSF